MTRRRRARAGMLVALGAWTCAFVALGLWQLERRVWKHALIAAVDARVHAPAAAAPGPGEWPNITADRDAYRHIRITGRFVSDRQVLTQAVTDRGAGYWVLTPIDAGEYMVLVNRGFIAQDQRDRSMRAPAGSVTVTGLLRMTEPGGGFLRDNDPAADRWYSRDVAAIAQKQGLRRTAPYFIDADAAANAPDQPVGGLTVIRFPDNHLVYALTWFGMAGLCVFGLWRLGRDRDRSE